MRLDKRSSVPLYAQLKELLSERIENGEYAPGQKIPTELALCSELELSRPTVRQAIAELVAEGLLIILKGKGTYVVSEPQRVVLDRFSGFTFSFLAGKTIEEKQFLDYTLAKKLPADVASAFGKGKTPDCYEIAWTNQDEGTVYAFAVSYIPQQMFPDLDESIRQGKRMIDITANRYAYLPQRVSHRIFVRPADAEEARILDVSRGTPVLVSQSVLLSRSGAPCEVNTTVMRGERVLLNYEIIGK